jgi:hypothetical protein
MRDHDQQLRGRQEAGWHREREVRIVSISLGILSVSLSASSQLEHALPMERSEV